MDLNSLIIIDKIASTGSFASAAKALRIPPSNLSLKVKQLEEELGQPIFTRTTRKVVITEFGERIRQKARPLVGLEDEIKSIADSESREPTGNIRVTTAFDIGLFLMREAAPAFLKAYPKLNLEIELTNQYRNIVDEGFDFAIRASRLKLADSSTVAIKLGESNLSLFVRRGDPLAKAKSINQIKSIPVLSFEGQSAVVCDGSKDVKLIPNKRMTIRDMAGVREALIGSGGVALLPDFTCTDSVSASQIVKILPKWSAGKASFYAICPNKQSLTTKSRLFLDHLKVVFS